MDNMTPKSASTQFLISFMKTFIEKKKSHTLRTPKPTAKLMKRHQLKLGTDMYTETKA